MPANLKSNTRRCLHFALALLASPLLAATSFAASSEVLDDVRIPDLDALGNEINQVSGLAWDQDEDTLYAVSDFGHIIHFKFTLAGGKITDLKPVYFGPLSNTTNGQTFSDAEDIAVLNGNNGIKGDSVIAVTFEDGPSAAKFSPAGKFIEQIALPPPLDDRASYQSANQRLESIAFASGYGFLFAPQVAVAGHGKNTHTVYAQDGTVWTYGALEPKSSQTKAMQLLPGGLLMLMESQGSGGLLSLVGADANQLQLRQLNLASCNGSTSCSVTDFIPVDPAPMQDRYEGMTQLGENLFLLATDENAGSRLILVGTKP